MQKMKVGKTETVKMFLKMDFWLGLLFLFEKPENLDLGTDDAT